MAILHICLNVSDADQLAEWYISQLDLEFSWEFTTEDGNTRNVYVADEDGVELQLSDTKGHTPSTEGDQYDHVAFQVDDADTVLSEIDHHGVVEEPTDQPAAGARTAFVKDPDGHHVELIEPP